MPFFKVLVCGPYHTFGTLFLKIADLYSKIDLNWEVEGVTAVVYLKVSFLTFEMPLFQLMETSGTDMLSDTDNRATISPLHLAVSTAFMANLMSCLLTIPGICLLTHSGTLIFSLCNSYSIVKKNFFNPENSLVH